MKKHTLDIIHFLCWKQGGGKFIQNSYVLNSYLYSWKSHFHKLNRWKTRPMGLTVGLNWLKQHNPTINWAWGRLALSCCSADLNSSVSAIGKGYSLPDPSDSDHISSLDLGLRLPSPSQNYSLPTIIYIVFFPLHLFTNNHSPFLLPLLLTSTTPSS